MAFAGVLPFAAIAGPSDRIRPGGYAPAKRRGAAIRQVIDETAFDRVDVNIVTSAAVDLSQTRGTAASETTSANCVRSLILRCR
jgi:hypothetical protein